MKPKPTEADREKPCTCEQGHCCLNCYNEIRRNTIEDCAKIAEGQNYDCLKVNSRDFQHVQKEIAAAIRRKS